MTMGGTSAVNSASTSRMTSVPSVEAPIAISSLRSKCQDDLADVHIPGSSASFMQHRRMHEFEVPAAEGEFSGDSRAGRTNQVLKCGRRTTFKRHNCLRK
jgi:hypothetical protein